MSNKWTSRQNQLWSSCWISAWNFILQVQSLWVRNLSSAHPEASPCVSGMLCHSEDTTPPWRLCRNIVQSSKQYFSHCIYCVYAQVCGICMFSTSGLWLDIYQSSDLHFFCSFYEGRTFKKEIYIWSHIVIDIFFLVWNLHHTCVNCIHCSRARLSK
jgi:hypothetical protein